MVEVSKEVLDNTYEALQAIKQSGKIKKGVNETTKSIERGIAMFVAYASDVEPAEIVAHIPKLCEEKKVPFIAVPSKLDLGKAIGLNVQCSAVAVENAGSAESSLKTVISKITGKSSEEKKSEPKKEEKAEEKKVEEKKEKAEEKE